MDAREIVQKYWEAMESNDFSRAAAFLSEGYICRWPQSKELIRGRENFIRINSEYPSEGLWRFRIDRIVAEGEQVATDVSITDGTMRARAVTFHRVVDGAIAEQTEYWPDGYEAPPWRRAWTEPLTENV